MPIDNKERIYTVKQAAQILDVSEAVLSEARRGSEQQRALGDMGR